MELDLNGDFFRWIRNENILPLASYKIKHKKSLDYEFKNFLSNNITSVINVDSSEYILEYDKDEFYKNLIIDIENLYSKSLIQLCDFRKNHLSLSPTWSFVTQYYFAFFNLNLFFRIKHQGFVYFDPNSASLISNICTALQNSMIKFHKGDYFFEIVPCLSVSSVHVRFKKSDTVHRSLWDKLNQELTIYERKASAHEVLVLNFIKQAQDVFGNNFPSEMRNKVNYQPNYGLKNIHKMLISSPAITSISEFSRVLRKYNGNIKVKSDDQLIECTCLIGFYFFYLCHKLRLDLETRAGKNTISQARQKYFSTTDIEKYLDF